MLYRIQCISDLDVSSKIGDTDKYKAVLKTGELVRALKQPSEGQTLNEHEVDSYEYSINVTATP